jgi:LEA14-like dessication related protein
MKPWKIIIIILLVLAAAGAIAFFWGKSVWDKITFGVPRVLGLDFNGITLEDAASIVLAGSQKEINALIAMDVSNKNNFSIPFSSLKVELLYNGQTIAETSDAFTQKQSIPANGVLYATDNVKIILSGAAAQLALDKLQNGKATINYKIKLNVFGIPLPKSFQTFSMEI